MMFRVQAKETPAEKPIRPGRQSRDAEREEISSGLQDEAGLLEVLLPVIAVG
jgi:hypothetical protein